MKEFVLEGAEITCRKELHTALQAGLSFPEHYGKNLDALHDCLTDLQEDTLIIVKESGIMREALGTYYKSFMRVLKDAQEENSRITFQEI